MEENNDNILEEGRKIYPINIACDERIDNIYKIGNWLEVFYTIKKGKMKERFIQQMKNSEYSEFFRGLNYEFGINGYKKDLKEAFKIYKNASNNTTDTLAMFRMYHIYKKDFKKFDINQRERIPELFYLFKCFSYSRYPIMQRNQNLFNKFDIRLEVLIHFDEEDNDKEKFHKFIMHLKEHYYLYDINKNDVDFIESVINIQIILIDEFDINNEITKLYDFYTLNNDLEAYYKFICFNKSLSDEYKEEEFKNLYNKKYYRSYIDYALFLNTKDKNDEALKILLEAKNNGIVSAGFIYFDIFLDNYDLNFLFQNSMNFSPKCELYNLLMILIDDINIDSIYSFYEYFFLLKICCKHYNLEFLLNVYFYDYTKEIADFLISMTKETDSYEGKKLIEKYYCDDDNYKEFNLACGVIHFYGIKNILKRNLDKALYHIKIAYKSSNNESYKRFCYFYIFKISEIFYKEKRTKDNEKNKNKIISNPQLLVTDTIIKNIRTKIFNDYRKSLEENKEGLSSSYYYYLSRLYHKKIGNPGDKILEYVCLQKASEYKNKNPGSGSIISFYRKFKSKKILEKNKKEFSDLFKLNGKIFDSEGYGEKGDICPICFDKKRNMVCYPCKHPFCNECIYKVEKCPICRKLIMLRYKFE